MPRQKKINGNKPITQKDLSLLAGQLTVRLNRMEKNMATKSDITRLEKGQQELKSDTASHKSSQEAILRVVQSIDVQLREHKTHPTRIRRLEKSAFHR